MDSHEIPLRGTATMSHITKLESIQSKILRTIVDASWFILNEDKRKNLGLMIVMDEIQNFTIKYKKRTVVHPN